MSGSKYKVLHVDDDPAATKVICHRLRQQGIAVTDTNDPTIVLDLLLHERFHVVLLDVDMSVLNGLDLLSQIKKFDGGISVIMVTGLVSMSTVLKSMRRGAAACFFKPLEDAGPLAEAIRTEFAKIDRWWDTLRDLSERRRQETGHCAGPDLASAFSAQLH